MHLKASTTLSSDSLPKMKELEEFSYIFLRGCMTSTDRVIDSLRSFVSAWCRKLAEGSRPVFDVLSKNHGFIIIYKSSLALALLKDKNKSKFWHKTLNLRVINKKLS